MIDIQKIYDKMKIDLMYAVDDHGWFIGHFEKNGDGTVTFYFEEVSGERADIFESWSGGKRPSKWKDVKAAVKSVEPSAVFDDNSFSARINE